MNPSKPHYLDDQSDDNDGLAKIDIALILGLGQEAPTCEQSVLLLHEGQVNSPLDCIRKLRTSPATKNLVSQLIRMRENRSAWSLRISRPSTTYIDAAFRRIEKLFSEI